jgi:hypothetical protein
MCLCPALALYHCVTSIVIHMRTMHDPELELMQGVSRVMA